MGLRDTFFRAVRGVAREAIVAPIESAAAWADEREQTRKLAEVDERIAKAAERAKAAGNDGNHDWEEDEDNDNGGGTPPDDGDGGPSDAGDGADGGDGDQGALPRRAGDNARNHGDEDGGGEKRGGTGKVPDDYQDPGEDGLGSTFPGKHNPARDAKALHFDPFDLVSLMGWRERPTAMSYVAMERVAQNVPVIADIIRARIKQVQTFCQRPEDRHAPGFKVRLRDKNAEPTEESDKRCSELEDVVLNCGFNDPKRPQDATPFKTFAGMFIRDTLSFDQAAFETVPDRMGRPSYWECVDATTIRLLDPFVQEDEGILAVQVIHDMVVADFNRDELAFCIRNPRSGVFTYGYGESEVETLIREITGFLWGIEYNRRFFSQGSAAKGILNFKGTIPDRHMTAFRRQWYAMVTGVSNAWRTPITNAEELQWINLQLSNRDMEYSAWMDFLIKICCARFQIAPEEVNFSYGNSGQSQAMGGANTEEKLKASKDLGLRPLVQWFFEQINRHFIWKLDPDYEVVPVGLDEKGAEAEADLLQKATAVYMTVDEAREVAGMEALPDKKGEVILNPTWLQYAQGLDAAEQGPVGPDGMPLGPGEVPPNENGDDHPTGGIGVQNEDGSPFDFDDEDDGDNGPPGPPAPPKGPPKGIVAPGGGGPVAKSLGRAIDSEPTRRVRRIEVDIASGP